MDAAIRMDRLARAFGETKALDGLTLEVAEGELFGLVGPDGAGKTTVLRLLTGVLAPTSGSASVAGLDVRRDAERVKEKIGYMSQRFGLYVDLTVAENLRFYADLYGVPRKALGERTDRLLDFAGLVPFRKRLAGNLSGGMKQKLGLACALIHTPEVLFLDEPTNGVDPVSRREFWRILTPLLQEKTTIFVSTAYLDEAERCHRIALLHEGRLLASGTPKEVKALMEKAILEIRTPESRRGARLLRENLSEEAVEIFGDRIHVVTEDPEGAMARVRPVLEKAGVAVLDFRPVAPSLEDVFVSVLS